MPPFFIPTIAFILWAFAIFFYLPGLRADIGLSRGLIGSQFFLSYLIHFFAWLFSGPELAAILTLLSSLLVIYAALNTKEPELFLQLFGYSIFFIFYLSKFQAIQKTFRDKYLKKEKLMEEVNLSRKASLHSFFVKKALEEKIDHFLSFQKFSESLKEKKTLDEIARAVVMQAVESFPMAEECALYLVDPLAQELSLVYGWRRDGNAVPDKTGSLFDRWVMKRSQAIVVEDAGNDFRFSSARQSHRHILKSICASPLIIENKVLGVLRVSSEEPAIFKSDDLRTLDIFSGLGAVAVRNILLYEKMGELAIRDSLTGLYLNRYFQERFSEEIKRAGMNGSVFSLILLDIDFFKRYNDEYGHAAGDIVLKSIAATLLKALETVDIAGRYGGEEFEILLPGKTKKEALLFAEQLRSRIEQGYVQLRRVETRVTASFGVAAFPEDGRSKEELMWAMDTRLYQAKQAGRNRVCGDI